MRSFCDVARSAHGIWVLSVRPHLSNTESADGDAREVNEESAGCDLPVKVADMFVEGLHV